MRKSLIIALFCFVIFDVNAQENLNKEVIDVIKDFRPKVIQAHKIKTQPLFIDTTKVSENLTYKIRFEEFRVSQPIDSLHARIVDRSALEKLYLKHVELGLGTLLNPKLAFDINNGKSTREMCQALVDYDGAFNGNMPNEDKYSKLHVGANYKRILNKYSLSSGIRINDVFRFDSLNTSIRNSMLDVNLNYVQIDSVGNVFPDRINFSASSFFNDLNFIERKFLCSSIHAGNHPFLNSWTIENEALIQKSNAFNYFQWNTKSRVQKTFDRTEIYLGFALDLLSKDVKFFPELRAQYQLIERGLYIYANIGGERDLYSWQNILTQNPYVENRTLNSMIDDIPEEGNESRFGAQSNSKYYGRLGLNGNLFRGVSYQASIEANTQDNYLHFVKMIDEGLESPSWHAVDYTDLNLVQMHFELDAKWTDKFHCWFKGDYRSFDNQLSYVPEIELGLYGDYHYNDQWFINLAARYIGKRQVITLKEDIEGYAELYESLLPSLELNCKVNFAFNNQLGFYVEGANMLNQDVVLWQQVPIIGRHVNFGAKYRF